MPFKEFLPNQNIKGKTNSDFSVRIECKDLVPRFSALDIENLKISASPDWLRFRLHRVGLRAISNLVDVTNYVMLDLGQPMHIFDKDSLSEPQLVVRKAKVKEKLMTLKEKEIELSEMDILISDGQKPVSLAGVIGGLNSGIQENTKNTLLEAACWDASTIRKTAARVRQRTDASQRFEKYLDPALTSLAIQRAVEILKISNPNLEIKGELIDIGEKIHSLHSVYHHSKCKSYPIQKNENENIPLYSKKQHRRLEATNSISSLFLLPMSD